MATGKSARKGAMREKADFKGQVVSLSAYKKAKKAQKTPEPAKAYFAEARSLVQGKAFARAFWASFGMLALIGAAAALFSK